MSSGGGEPLVALRDAVLAWPDGKRAWQLDASAAGSRVTLVGDFTPFFAFLSGELTLRQGSIHIGSLDARLAVASGSVGIMRRDAALPRGWSSSRYLEESARLGGRARGAARELARDTLRRFELETLAQRALGSLSTTERRVFALANAALLAPKTLVCEAPLCRLEADSAERVSLALERAARGCSLIASIDELPSLGVERVLADRSDSWIVLDGARVAFSGAPSARTPKLGALSVTVSENWEAFEAALRARGLSAEPRGFVDALHFLELPRDGLRFFRFHVELPAGTRNHGIFEASLAARAPIVDLRPAP